MYFGFYLFIFFSFFVVLLLVFFFGRHWYCFLCIFLGSLAVLLVCKVRTMMIQGACNEFVPLFSTLMGKFCPMILCCWKLEYTNEN